MNEFQQGIAKLKAKIALKKAEHDVKNAVNDAKDNLNDLIANAKAYVNQQTAANETADHESWTTTLKNDLQDGWSEIKDTTKEAWNSAFGNNDSSSSSNA